MKRNRIFNILLSIFIMIGSFTAIQASEPLKLETSLIDYDFIANGYMGVGTEVIPNGSTLEKGQAFQLNVDLVELGSLEVDTFNLRLIYDIDVIEPLYYENDGVTLLYSPQELKESTIFPRPPFGAFPWSSGIRVNHNNEYILNMDASSNSWAIKEIKDNDTLLISLFFRVKEDAAPGSEIKFEFAGTSNVNDVSTGSNKNYNINDSGFAGEMAYGTVAGGVVEENNGIDNISIKGSTGVETHEYLEFNPDKEDYTFVVPPSVKSLDFNHVLADPSSNTQVSHGKLNEQGNVVGGYSLSVGDNKFVSVVKDSGGKTVKTYNYNVKRLSNSTNYSLSGFDNNNHYYGFTTDEVTVQSSASTVDLDVTIDDGSSFEFEIKSSETNVAGSKVTILQNKDETPFTLEFTPEDLMSQYDDVPGINDNRSQLVTKNYKFLRDSDDNSLKEVKVINSSNNDVLKTWNVSQNEYELEVNNDVQSIDLEIETTHDSAKIMSNLKRVDLNPGLNTFEIQVNAPDGTPKNYKFKINRTPRSVAELDTLSIKIDGVEKNAPISSVDKTTRIDLDYKESYSLEILAKAKTDEGAILVSGNVKESIGVGTHNYDLVVKAEDNSTTYTYKVVVVVKPNNESDIEGGLKPNPDIDDEIKGEIVDDSTDGEKDGDVKIYRYSLDVLYSKETFSLSDLSFKQPDNSTLTGGQSIDLNVGENTFEFEIKSQDGESISRYIITVNRLENHIASIKGLTITSDPQGKLTGNLESGFVYNVAASVLEYKVAVEIDDNSIVDEDTIGTFDLLDSEHEHIVKVTSQDGSATKQYKITIKRGMSNDASLSSFKVSYGDVVDIDYIDQFSGDGKFTLNVGNDIDEIIIDAKTSHPKANFWIKDTSDKTFTLDYGSNTFDIEVQSESNTYYSYVFTVVREKSDNALLSKLEVNGKLVSGFRPEVEEYTLDNVDEDVESLNINAIPQNEFATVNPINNKLNHGDNTIEIVVKAQNNSTKTYKINVYRELSSSTDIGEDGINPNVPNHDIESTDDPYRYTVYVPFGTETYGINDFEVDLEDGAKLEYEKESIVLSETLEYEFTVVSPNGKNSQAYIIEVIILDSAAPRLNNIYVNGERVEDFDPYDFEFVVQLNNYLEPEDVDFEFTVDAESGINIPYIPKLEVTGKDIIKHSISITSTTNGLISKYDFTFTRTKSTDNTLSDLIIDEGTITPSFEENPDGPFTVDVEGDVDSINIDAKLNNPNSSVEGDGKIDLVTGENNVTVTVTPEDGPTKDYEITINRPVALKELKLGDVEVDLSTGSKTDDTVTYTITNPFDADVLEAYLHVVANHESVTIQGDVNTDIDLDNKDIKFTLVSQDEKSKLNVVVKYERTLSDDARLKELKSLVDGLEIKNFNPDTTEYEIEVEHDFLVLNPDNHLSWKTKHPNTTVTPDEELEISNKNENRFEINTESESGETKTYTLIITRGTYNFLDNLTIRDSRGHLEQEFKPEKLEYDALVYSGFDRFSFEWKVQDGVVVQNANELRNISTDDLPNEYKIIVEGDNGETNTYKIYVDKGVSTRLTNLNTSEGKIDFSPNVYDYDVYVAEDTEVVSLIDIVKEDEQAELSGNYVDVQLGGHTTPVSVKVTNSGHESIYTVNFIRTEDLTEIDNIIAYDEDDIWHSVKKDDVTFEITVDYGIDLDTLDYSVALVDKSGSYVVSEPNKTDDAYEYVVSVTDKYGIKKDYDLIVKNDLSDNNYLESLTVDGKLVAGFNRYATSYNYPTYYSDDLLIEAIAEDENADVMMSDFVNDNNGGYIDITVTSHKGSPNVYRLNFEKENIATLDSLSLKEAGISPDFNKDVNKYYASVPYELDEVTVVYEFDHNGSVLVNGQNNDVVSLTEGKNTIEVTVTAEDDTEFVYTIEVTRNKKAANYLNTLEVRKDDTVFDLKPPFDKDTLVYNVTIDNTLETVTVDGTFDSGLKVIGLEDVTIKESLTTHQVIVSENGIPRIYTINLIKEASDDATLKEIKYDPEKGTLTDLGSLIVFEVGNEETFNIKAIPTDPNATVSNDGEIDLVPGDNLVTIIITAEDNVTTSEYKVLIKRDVILESVNIGGIDYSVTVDENDKSVYVIDDKIDPEVVKSRVVPTFSHSSVGFSDLENDITFGTSGNFTLNAIPRDGDKQELVVKYERNESSDATLSKLVVNNKEVPLVDGQFEYEVELPFNFEEFIKNNHLDTTTSHPNATVSGKSQIEISPGVENEYIITVKAENGYTQEYTLKLTRADYDVGPSTLLESLAVDHGKLNFVSQNMVYEIKVNNEVTEVIVSDIVPVDKDADVSSSFGISNETMTVPLDNDKTEAKITVTNGGYVTIYTLNFVKVEKQTGIDDITVNDGENIWKGEINDDGQYEVIVDNDTNLDDLEIDINTEFPNSDVEINGPTKDKDGNDHYEIIVTDENGTEEEFDLIIKKDKSNNAFLESLKVFNEGIIGFNKHTNDYTYVIKPDTTISVADITAITEDKDANADVAIDGDVITITVTAPNGKKNIYTITVELEEDKLAILESLRLLETGISPKFSRNEAKYYASVPYEVDAVTVIYQASGEADVKISAKTPVDNDKNIVSSLNVGQNVIDVTVSNGEVSYVYTIYVERSDKSESNYLDSLVVVDYEDEDIVYEFSTSFDKDTLVYGVEVPYGVNSFTIKGEYDEDNLTVSGLDMLIINKYPYVHKVRVADEYGIVREYSITFIQDYSNDTHLGDLSVSPGSLEPIYDKDITTYDVYVDYSVDEIDINYLEGADDQLVTGAGTHNLDVGRNTFEVTVRSGNARNVYTVHVHRAVDIPRLSDLSVSEGDLTPEFDDNTFVYKVTVDENVTEIDVFADSEYEVKGAGNYTLKKGENIILIDTINGNRKTTTYLVVYRESNEEIENDAFYEENVDLAYLDLIEESLNEEFKSNKYDYTSDLSKPYYEELGVIAVPRNPKANVEISGNTDLDNGTHEILVTVSLDNGKSKTTTIEVTIDNQVLESDIHEIGDTYIATIKELQTVLDVKNQMLNDNAYLKIIKDGNELDDNDRVGTGAIIKLIVNEKEYDSKILVIKGDVNGDGEVSIPDRMQAQSKVLGDSLTDVQMVAADVTNDNDVQINDVMLIQAHILDLENIFEMEE